MRARIVSVTIAVIALVLPSARAATNVVLAGSGTFGESSCLTVVRTSNASGAGSRSLGAYWPSSPAPPGGLCSEEDPHVDLTLTCVAVEGSVPGPTVLYATAKGTDNLLYLVKIVDSGVGATAPDEAGVVQAAAEQGAEHCGVHDVPTSPITAGAFVSLAV